MMVLVTYDVNTETPAGRKRLHLVAKQCKDYGQRVQNSVFECLVDPAQMVMLKSKLEKIINAEKDSVRFYYLGNEWRGKVEHVGAKKAVDLEGTIIV
jgi:CRISPR-associated protein Cas2